MGILIINHDVMEEPYAFEAILTWTDKKVLPWTDYGFLIESMNDWLTKNKIAFSNVSNHWYFEKEQDRTLFILRWV